MVELTEDGLGLKGGIENAKSDKKYRSLPILEVPMLMKDHIS